MTDVHPYQLFPDLSPDEYEALKNDIRDRGVQVPVEYDDEGNLLDGHHRVRACLELGIKEWPRIVRVGMTEAEKRNHIRALNILRRNLTPEQRNAQIVAMRQDGMSYRAIGDALGVSDGTVRNVAAQNCAPQPETVTGKDGKQYPPRKQRKPSIFAKTEREMAGAVEKAQSVVTAAEEQPDLFSDLPQLMDDTSIDRAYKEMRRRQNRAAVADTVFPSGIYRVFYADPPWEYGQVIDKYGPAERHYATMTLDELCAMGPDVRSASAENAVLFLWSTSPKLRDAFAVADAWGFRYTGAMFVWDKVLHNYGHYNSVRHELLLICVKGSCTPDTSELIDSVQSIERSGEHSEKPEEFRTIIDTLYPHGPRLELFARKRSPGWDAWGAEADR